MATVVNVRKKELNQRGIQDFAAWVSRPQSLYIGREMSFYVKGAVGSKWANPFSVKKYGRERCLALYETYIRTTPELYSALEELRGKELGCWCKPEGCHGDVLLRLLQEKKKKK